MGGNNFSEEELAARAKLRVDTGAPVFAYDLAMKKGSAECQDRLSTAGSNAAQ
jgi:hypothetical protein